MHPFHNNFHQQNSFNVNKYQSRYGVLSNSKRINKKKEKKYSRQTTMEDNQTHQNLVLINLETLIKQQLSIQDNNQTHQYLDLINLETQFRQQLSIQDNIPYYNGSQQPEEYKINIYYTHQSTKIRCLETVKNHREPEVTMINEIQQDGDELNNHSQKLSGYEDLYVSL